MRHCLGICVDVTFVCFTAVEDVKCGAVVLKSVVSKQEIPGAENESYICQHLVFRQIIEAVIVAL